MSKIKFKIMKWEGKYQGYLDYKEGIYYNRYTNEIFILSNKKRGSYFDYDTELLEEFVTYDFEFEKSKGIKALVLYEGNGDLIYMGEL